MRASDAITPEEEASLTAHHRDRLRSLNYADRAVPKIIKALKRAGEYRNTYIVVWSDNGYHMGQHRLQSQTVGGKSTPYTEDVSVPMWASGPGIPAGSSSDALVSGVDVAPTFAEMAGAEVPPFVDGRSFLGAAKDPGSPMRAFAYSEATTQTVRPRGAPYAPTIGRTTSTPRPGRKSSTTCRPPPTSWRTSWRACRTPKKRQKPTRCAP